MKLHEAAGLLANLENRPYTLRELVDIAKSVTNLKSQTQDCLRAVPYESGRSDLLNLLDPSVKVDITYQRKMRLVKLLNKLTNAGGFNKEGAGHIDVAIRKNGDKFIWDGFRRAFMALLCGLEEIPASFYRHTTTSEIQAAEYEAKMFKMRNADSEAMAPEEIFRAKIVYKDTIALSFLEFLKECHLDVEGLNPGYKTFGGFVAIEKSWLSKVYSDQNLIDASSLIQNVWPVDPTVSGYLMCGVACFLKANEETVGIDSDTIFESFAEYIDQRPPVTQKDLTKHRLAGGKSDASIAYIIAKNVMGLDKKHLDQFTAYLELDTTDTSMINFE